MAYNTNLLKPQDLPKGYDDLLDPKWKGKMLMDSRETEWYASMLQILGREKALRLMRGLAKQDLSFRPGRTLITQVLASGEAPLAVNDYDHLVQSAKKRGAPVESLPITPVVSRVTPIALGRYAPHPNIGKLFIDFSLSEEGQKFSGLRPQLGAQRHRAGRSAKKRHQAVRQRHQPRERLCSLR